jgi:hypothetical protein
MSESLEIHQYDGPNGKGYEVRLYVTIAGVAYRRSIDSGAEPYRNRAWGVAR